MSPPCMNLSYGLESRQLTCIVERAKQVRSKLPSHCWPLVKLTVARIRFMRMSSEMFPFASHAKYGYDLAFAGEGLKAAGDLAKKYGHRLTMHPGQASLIGWTVSDKS